MYYCNDCYQETSKPLTRIREIVDVSETTTEVYLDVFCPNCASIDMTPLYQCKECDDYYPEDSMDMEDNLCFYCCHGEVEE